MPKVLVVFAHPALERSRINRRLVAGIRTWGDVTFRDLYQLYPDFYVDVAAEQEQLLLHEAIVWQFPLYWYSIPPLLKQWIDLTLEHDWAYGSRGVYLRGKRLRCVVTAGGSARAYCSRGYNGHTIEQFLLPLERTARLCGMTWLRPHLVHGTHALRGEAIEAERVRYEAALRAEIAPAVVDPQGH